MVFIRAAKSVAACAVWMALSSAAMAYPVVSCDLSADKSSVIVTGSNDDGTAYNCTASCRLNLTGQRALEPFSCNFRLGPQDGAKTVCEREGGAPDFFSKVGPTGFVCAPRN